MAYDFITIGGATKDLSLFTAEGVLLDNSRDLLRQELIAFEQGAKIGVDRVWESFGGGAANTAVNLAHLGFKVATICEVGRDFVGQEIIDNLKRKKVITNLVGRLEGDFSGMSLILITPNGERVIFAARGANKRLDLNNNRKRALAKSSNVYLTSLSGAWYQDLREIFTAVTGKIFWNPGSSQLKAGLRKLAPFLKRTTALMLNRDEALELLLTDKRYQNQTKKQLQKPEFLLKALKEYGPEVVVVTDGRNGAYFMDDNQIHYQPINKDRKIVDATGIGDAYNSTWAATWLLNNYDLKKSARLASRQAAAKISHHGAQNGLKTLKELTK